MKWLIDATPATVALGGNETCKAASDSTLADVSVDGTSYKTCKDKKNANFSAGDKWRYVVKTCLAAGTKGCAPTNAPFVGWAFAAGPTDDACKAA
jgi:hypothetical protein